MLRDRHIDASSRSCKCVAFSRYGVHVAVVIDDSPVNINIFSISSVVKDVNLSSLCKHTDMYLYSVFTDTDTNTYVYIQIRQLIGRRVERLACRPKTPFPIHNL